MSENVKIYYSVNDIKVNNESKMPDQKPFTLNGTTFVPLRYMADTFGYEVNWDGNTKTIYLNSPGVDATSSATQKQQVVEHNIAMEIYQFGYTPNTIEVMEGDIIHLTIKAVDVAHGFRINEYNINEQLDAGESKSITFEADKKEHLNMIAVCFVVQDMVQCMVN